jgi:EmrB/QacA subfamily drug resistance transporter
MRDLDRKWWTLIAVCTAIFMLLLDITVVNVALPDVQRDLDASFAQLQWVIDVYALTLATTVLAAGSLADMFGRRLVFTIGLAVFTIASFGCGIAGDAGVLIGARAVQGVGGGIMFATSLALLANAFHGRERGTAFGIWGATTGAAVAIGPLVGGVLTESAGWRWIFFVNVPIGIAAVFGTIFRVDESRDPAGGRVDWLGTVSLTGMLFLLVYGLLQGNEKGWSSSLILFCLIGAAVLLVLFVAVELGQRRPMLDVRLFLRGGFVGAQIAALAISASIFSVFIYLTLYLQNVLGYSPLAAGARFLPLTLFAFLVAAISGNLTARVPARWLMGAGLAVIGVSLLLMARVDSGSRWTVLLPGFVLGGIGVGLTNPALASTAVSVVPPERSGMASGTNTTFRQIGIATGIAALGALFQNQIGSKLAEVSGTRPGHGVITAVASGHFPPSLAQPARAAFIDSLGTILNVGAVIALAGAVLVVVLLRGHRPHQGGPPAAAAEQTESS